MKLSKRNEKLATLRAEKRAAGKPVQSKYAAKVRAQFVPAPAVRP